MGAEVYFIGPELDTNAAKFMEKGSATIPVLLDSAGEVMEAFRIAYAMPDYMQPDYGERFVEVNPAVGWRLPIPATFVLDQSGTVRARWVNADYRYRMEPDDVVAAVRAARTG